MIASYVGLYVTDDNEARKKCKTQLVYGTVNCTFENLKYMDLWCPVCEFAHNFKRESWYEGDLTISDGKGLPK